MSYQIKLNVFEGPYDLLLFLIRRGELDIYDIPIAKITKEFLEYIDYLRSLDLEVAGEFLVVAATLMRIKVRFLLPVHVEEEEEEEDPREQLIRSLLEYQKIKEASEKLGICEEKRRDLFVRGQREKFEEADGDEEDYDMQMTVYELVLVYNQVIKRERDKPFHYVEPEPATIEDQMEHILTILKTKKKISFNEFLMQAVEPIIVVLNFLSMLELANRRIITIAQASSLSEIWITKRKKK